MFSHTILLLLLLQWCSRIHIIRARIFFSQFSTEKKNEKKFYFQHPKQNKKFFSIQFDKPIRFFFTECVNHVHHQFIFISNRKNIKNETILLSCSSSSPKLIKNRNWIHSFPSFSIISFSSIFIFSLKSSKILMLFSFVFFQFYPTW